ncbi:MAG: hypothetical protein ABFS08_11295 [Pseudomonadota bacterium]
MKKYLKPFCLVSLVFVSFAATAGKSANLYITSGPVKPKTYMAVKWDGPDNNGDKIVLVMGGSHYSVYTSQGNSVGFHIGETPGKHELQYMLNRENSFKIIARVDIDCRKKTLSRNNGNCKVPSKVLKASAGNGAEKDTSTKKNETKQKPSVVDKKVDRQVNRQENKVDRRVDKEVDKSVDKVIGGALDRLFGR